MKNVVISLCFAVDNKFSEDETIFDRIYLDRVSKTIDVKNIDIAEIEKKVYNEGISYSSDETSLPLFPVITYSQRLYCKDSKSNDYILYPVTYKRCIYKCESDFCDHSRYGYLDMKSRYLFDEHPEDSKKYVCNGFSLPLFESETKRECIVDFYPNQLIVVEPVTSFISELIYMKRVGETRYKLLDKDIIFNFSGSISEVPFGIRRTMICEKCP